ncbi:MAG: hypothetical protein JSW51_00365 [Gemmatimonadota bacterium]|nr:MAG: hypothetical protein JSW51_00365 [Gemmatimonadota bacterium]
MRSRQLIVAANAMLVMTVACAPSIGVPGPTQMQAWAVYFDGDRGLAELEEHGDLFDRVSLFGYELSPDGSPVPAPNVKTMLGPFLRLAQEKGFEPWVTVVNDVRHSGDSVVAKDSTVVHELLVDSSRRDNHVRELVALVVEAGFQGLHLDYEQVAESDSAQFQGFIERLSGELRQRERGLEVVLEPVNGPLPAAGTSTVIVMAYDLFGAHSGPGPRSTPDFVTGLGPRAEVDADSAAALAVAVRGFAWRPNDEVTSLDWSEAQQRAAGAQRARRSAADVPNARLDDGTEIWFEDRASLISKWRAAWLAGFRRLAIWRLGGNDERLFDLLRDLRPDSE